MAMIADTLTSAGSRTDLVLSGIVMAVWCLFVAAYVLRIWSAPEAPKKNAPLGATVSARLS